MEKATLSEALQKEEEEVLEKQIQELPKKVQIQGLVDLLRHLLFVRFSIRTAKESREKVPEILRGNDRVS